jgi:hypothetical protein
LKGKRLRKSWEGKILSVSIMPKLTQGMIKSKCVSVTKIYLEFIAF